MKTKKWLVVLFILCLALSSFAGCRNKNGNGTSPSPLVSPAVSPALSPAATGNLPSPEITELPATSPST